MSKPGLLALPFRVRLVAAFAAIYIIWGSTYLAIRFAIETLPPFLMIGSRFMLAGALLYGWSRWRGAPRPTMTNWWASGIVGALLLFGGTGIVAWAEQTVPSGLASLLVATVPVWIVLIEWLRPGGKRPNLGVVTGLTLGFGGVILLVSQGQMGNGQHLDILGAIIVVLAALSWAVGSLYSRTAPIAASPLLATGMQMLVGGALIIVVATFTGEWSQLHLENLSLKSGLAYFYLVIVGSLVAFTAFIWLLKVCSPELVSTYAYVNPSVAVFLGWALNNEQLGGQTLIAFVMIVAAIVIVTLFRSRAATKAKNIDEAASAKKPAPNAKTEAA